MVVRPHLHVVARDHVVIFQAFEPPDEALARELRPRRLEPAYKKLGRRPPQHRRRLGLLAGLGLEILRPGLDLGHVHAAGHVGKARAGIDRERHALLGEGSGDHRQEARRRQHEAHVGQPQLLRGCNHGDELRHAEREAHGLAARLLQLAERAGEVLFIGLVRGLGQVGQAARRRLLLHRRLDLGAEIGRQ
ncbi:MAG TPA: hypothetical protein VFR34_00130, partial [Paracoccaceae bacterium]|nr:hypothetical protein [Paracoccaceae bacterium]